MIYQTRLWHFYWGRLGYESNTLSTQCKHVERIPESDSSTKLERTREAEPPTTRGVKSSVD